MSFEAFEAIVESRLRLMLRNRWLIAIFGILLIGGLAGLGLWLTERPTVLRLAAGPAKSLDVRVAETLRDTFDKEHSGYRLKLIETDGPAKSGKLIEDGATDLAIVRGDVGLSPRGLAVAIARREVAVLMVPAAHGGKKGKSGAKIEKVGDLKGRRIGLVQDSDAASDLLKVVLAQFGVPSETVKVTQLDVGVLDDAIAKNDIDAVFVAAPAGGKVMQEAVAKSTFKKEAPTFLDLQAEAIEKRDPRFDSTELPAGTFGGTPAMPDDSLTTLGVAHYIVARKSLSEVTTAEFSKLLYNDRQVLATAFPGMVKIEAPSTDKDAAVSIHPGTAAYLGDSQKSFFDRYGDTIFYGLLILPFFGSAAAGVVSYFKAGSRSKRLRLVNHLMEIVHRARRADNMATLDHLQSEADRILKITLHQITSNQMDEGIMQSFSLALDQARLAIADRRACLLGVAPPAAEAAVHEFKAASTG